MKMKVNVNDLTCPKCGCGECTTETPSGEERLLIRGYKVVVDGEWQSCCLVCSGYYWKHSATGPDLSVSRWVAKPDAEKNYKEHGYYTKGVPMYWFSDSTKHRLSPPTARKRDIWS